MLKKIKGKVVSLKGFVTAFVVSILSMQSANAAMPTVEANSDGAGASSGMWAYLTGWVKDIMVWAPLVVMSAATMWVAWSLLQKVLSERNAEKPNWGSVFAHAAGCILLLVITVFLGNQTINVWS